MGLVIFKLSLAITLPQVGIGIVFEDILLRRVFGPLPMRELLIIMTKQYTGWRARQGIDFE